MEKVNHRLHALEGEAALSITDYRGEDREAVEHALLFFAYYDFAHRFDQLIERQVANGDAPQSVEFADDFIRVLTNRRFSPDQAHRYLGLCYQIRRAFYFIERHIVGQSPCMKRLREDLWNNVFTHDIGIYEKFLWNRMEDFSTGGKPSPMQIPGPHHCRHQSPH
ncbi:MAG: hypothetical protein HKP58_16395 [Desulfatitalea sp.]|nr:hypothetical protein [Desulfatitalea sp.]